MTDTGDRGGDGSRQFGRSTRRTLLATLGLSGTVALAGCGGGDGQGGQTETPTRTPTETQQVRLQTRTATPTATPTPEPGDETATETATETQTPTETAQTLPRVEGQSLQLPAYTNPGEASFLVWGWNAVEGVDLQGAGWEMDHTLEPPFWGRFLNEATPFGTLHPLAFESVETTSRKVKATIRDDALWSDGEPITARDVVTGLVRVKLEKVPPWEVQSFDDVALGWDAVTSFEFPDGLDGRRLTLASSLPDPWTKLTDFETYTRNLAMFGGIHAPTHVEPYGSFFDELWKTWEDGKANEEFDHGRVPIEEEVFDASHAEKFSDPENVVTNGVFQLSEIRGTQEFVLTKNPHHRLADEVNFDEVVMTYMPGEQRERASLNASRLDYSPLDLSPQVRDALPEEFEHILRPSGGGGVIEYNQADPHFGKRNVRAAVQYVLNTENIASTVQPELASPVDVPGGDIWGREQFLSDEWVETNLINYGKTPNVEEATSLMESAGYSKQSDQWVGPEGDALSYQFPTTSSTPKFGTLVAQQLSNFGIETTVQTYDGAVYNEKMGNEEFQFWRGGGRLAGFLMDASKYYHAKMHQVPPKNDATNIWPDSFFERAAEAGAMTGGADGWFREGATEWRKRATIEAPPVGEPDGQLEKWPVGLLSLTHVTPVPQLEQRMKTLMWLYNWHLPGSPVFQTRDMRTIDAAHWIWPRDNEEFWENVGLAYSASRPATWGKVMANPDDPEEGADVRQ